jgi:hypothetical protein
MTRADPSLALKAVAVPIDPASIVAAFDRQGFRIRLIPPDGALVIQDRVWRDQGRKEPRIPSPLLMDLFSQRASAIGSWLERRGDPPLVAVETEAERSRDRFDAKGWATKAFAAGWRADELYRIPPSWSRVDLTGAAFQIGDRKVIEVTSDAIVLETASGSRLKLRRTGRQHIP